MIKSNAFHRILICIMSLCFTYECTFANEADSVETDTLPTDLSASLIITGPGETLYSRLGHCSIRMQGPKFGLDFIYSYESEDQRSRVLSFLAGKLKMGMYVLETKEVLSIYKTEGRRALEYKLNLPISVLRDLWKILDKHVESDYNLPYDYLNRGCAHSVLMFLTQACGKHEIQYGPWPEKYQKMTRREICYAHLHKYPWTEWELYMITNGVIDNDCQPIDKVLVPADLIEVLSLAKVDGKPILTEDPVELCPETLIESEPFITPLAISIIILILTTVSILLRNKFRSFDIMTYLVLTIQTGFGLVTTYLVFFSSLPCTEWSWLIIPFNPLPLILWKWRSKWCLSYAVVILLWIIGIIVYPHKITGWSYVTLAAALAADYLYLYFLARNAKPIVKPARSRKNRKWH